MTTLAYANSVLPELSGYAPQHVLASIVESGKIKRAWLFGGSVVSLQLPSGELWKAKERLGLPDDKATGILTRLEALGVRHPSSWASCYDQIATIRQRPKHTHNGLFFDWHGGPWHEALRTGKQAGRWWRYDIQSAYKWAATLGVPDVSRFVVRTRWHSDSGLWLYRWKGKPLDGLPRTLRESRDIVVSSDEIEAYQMPASGIVRGITWDNTLPGTSITDVLDKLPKQASRAYWGKWCARDKLRCITPNSSWELDNHRLNLVWAWLIVGRVRSRVWQVAKHGAAHVYVDEAIVPYQLPTGTNAGSWRLKEEFANGIEVDRIGAFRRSGDTHYSMKTGVKQ